MKKETRPWGTYEIIYNDATNWTKLLTVEPGESLSLQYHHYRAEYWLPLDIGLQARIRNEFLDLQPGVRYTVPRETVHRLMNPSHRPARLIEVAVGPVVSETDIVRLSDKYGRLE